MIYFVLTHPIPWAGEPTDRRNFFLTQKKFLVSSPPQYRNKLLLADLLKIVV